MVQRIPLASSAMTAQTFTSVSVEADWDSIAFEFVVDVAGATPTITWKVQGSIDDLSVVDGSANWYDVGYITDASDTLSQAARTATAVGAQIAWLSNPVARRYHRFRLVTTSDTNITYHADMFLTRS
jgi:hypothetical protein